MKEEDKGYGPGESYREAVKADPDGYLVWDRAQEGVLRKALHDHAARMSLTVDQYIESMAAAWWLRTGIPPERAVICYGNRGNYFEVWIEERKP